MILVKSYALFVFSANSETVSNLPRSPQRRSSPESNSSEYFTPTGPSGDQCKFRDTSYLYMCPLFLKLSSV